MQPFFSRTSRSTSTSSCSISNAVFNSTSRTRRPASADMAIAGGGDADGMLKRKFGEFYKRFYSAIAETVAEEKDQESHRSNRRSHAAAELPKQSTSTIPPSHPTPRHELAHIEDNWKKIIYRNDAIAPEPSMSDLNPFPRKKTKHGLHQPRTNRHGPHSDHTKASDRNSTTKLPGSSPSKVSEKPVNKLRKHQPNPDVVELATVAMTSRILQHERLCRELKIEIFKRKNDGNAQREQRGWLDSYEGFVTAETAKPHATPTTIGRNVETEDERNRQDVSMLQKTLKFISSFYYEELPAFKNSSDASSPTESPRASKDILYKPPFPSYTSLEQPTDLNRYLYSLLTTRPAPAFLLPKICYNLLTSPTPPDIKTYNILIQGFTWLRQNSLAHVVFRNLVEGGLGLGKAGGPDEYTLAATLNLCVKSADYEGFRRIANITTKQNKKSQPRYGFARRRHKMVLEALISAAARFGKIRLVFVYLKAMKRECPWSPRLRIAGLTSLLRLWTEKKDWEKGKKTWREILWLNTCAEEGGEGGEKMDVRSFHQMLDLCRECGKTKAYAKVLELGAKKGWQELRLVEAQNKTKGLPLRRENKTPDLRRSYRKVKIDNELLRILRRTWSSSLSFQDRIEVLKDTYGGSIDPYELGEIPTSPGEHPASSSKETASPYELHDSTKAKVWKRLVSHRITSLPPRERKRLESKGYSAKVARDVGSTGVTIRKVYF